MAWRVLHRLIRDVAIKKLCDMACFFYFFAGYDLFFEKWDSSI